MSGWTISETGLSRVRAVRFGWQCEGWDVESRCWNDYGVAARTWTDRDRVVEGAFKARVTYGR